MPATVIYPARSVVTMDPARPRADAVAVRDGRFLGVGTVQELERWGDHEIDDRFRDLVLLPGFVEAHAHVFAGGLWAFPYVGYYERRDPKGVIWRGCTSIEAVIERLRDLHGDMDDPSEPLIAWGLDPISFPGERLVARHLDRVSETRPIFVFHISGHLATVNSVVLERAGLADRRDIEGVMLGDDGRPNGELREPPAMVKAGDYLQRIGAASGTEDAIRDFAALARNAGITTVADLGTVNLGEEASIERWEQVTGEPGFAARTVLYFNPRQLGRIGGATAAEAASQLPARNTDRLRFGGVKLILDGSIQGFSARICWPGYLDTDENGIWLYTEHELHDMVAACHRAGLNVHVHCNGDEAVDRFLDAVEAALLEHPWLDHRHTVEHCQLTRPDQYRRMARLGVCANIFSNHLWYWGDQHHDITVGPDRAERMDAAGTALRSGIPFALHSDAHVTPLGQLHTAWCAVNRITPSGRVLGQEERISVEAALRAVTVDAAYVLHMDREVGSIEPGKRADLAVLEKDPLKVDPMHIRDIPVRGTMLGGEVHADV